ncbi:MAG: hypothetical protein AABZ55_03855, partial [Bdellovibrionota bacterium]
RGTSGGCESVKARGANLTHTIIFVYLFLVVPGGAPREMRTRFPRKSGPQYFFHNKQYEFFHPHELKNELELD